MNWTAENIPDLTGKKIIITGSNSGLGYQAAKEFSAKGAEVIIACRNLTKAHQAISDIQQSVKKHKLSAIELDLSDLASVKKFAAEFKTQHTHLDILLNNAGIMTVPYELTKDGFESQIGINHLGHFALTGLLLDMLKSTPKSRVVTVSSMAHKMGDMDFDNLLFENKKGYSRIKAYGRAKLANLFFAYELQRRFEKAGIDSISLAAHPGVSDTNLDRYIPKLLRPISHLVFAKMGQPASMGALPEMRAAVDKDAKGGQYYGPDSSKEWSGYPVVVESNTLSHDIEVAQKLWQASENLTGIVYKFTNNL